MQVEEIFNKLATHMQEGIMYHNEMAKAYDFLGFWGFAKCQMSHARSEKEGLQCLSHYYATHYYKLLQLEKVEEPKLIPDAWYKYTTMAVDTGTKRNAIKELMTKWVEWERSTKKLYQEMRHELTLIGEVAAAMKLDEYICDVSKELCHAEKKLLKLETVGYDIQIITEMEAALDRKYTKKLGW